MADPGSIEGMAPRPPSEAAPVARVGAPGPAHVRRVVLSVASTPAERKAVERWLEREWGSVSAQTSCELVSHRDPRFEARLAGDDDPIVIPVRVAWLPSVRGGDRVADLGDLLSFSDPWHPPRRLQARIVRDEPDRCRVIAGEATHVSELRRSWREEGGIRDFGPHVLRQATLALDRAEWAVVGHRYKVPRLVIEQIEDRPEFQDALAGMARSLGRSLAGVQRAARSCLREMVTTQTRLGIDLFYGQLGKAVLGRLAVDVDAARLEELRALNRNHALVFLPSHKSYIDPLLLGRTLQRHGFPPNILVGGINLSFWPLGSLARRAGILFIRRSFKDDDVYKVALQGYMRLLVRERFNLEWYIEGGRSRTGKLRRPRHGLLGYLAEAVSEPEARDVYLVPTAIAFDQLYELKAMAAEALGVGKKAESLQWMVEYVQAQRRSRGKAWVRFGTPLSLREALAAVDGAVQDPGTRARAVQKTALEVCHRINRATPITPTSLVTFALLGVEDRALTLAEIEATLEPILEYASKRDLPTVGGLLLGDDAPIREALETLERQGVVRRFTEGTEPVYAIGADEHLVAAFYRNSTIHFFVNRAIVETVMARGAEERFTGLDQVIEEAVRLRELLIFEFIFPRKRDFLEALRQEVELFGPGWEQNVASPELTRAMLERSRLHVAHRVLRSFLEAYQVVADHLAAQPPGLPLDEHAFLAQCVGIARQYRLQHRIWSTESISQELFGNALSVARHRGLLATDGDNLQARRRALSDEIADHVGRIATIRDFAVRDLREILRRGRRTEGGTGWTDPTI